MSIRVLRKFSFVGALLWLGVVLTLAISLTYYLEGQMFREVSLASLDYFQAVTRNFPLDEDFIHFRKGEDPAWLERILAPLLKEQKVVTVKLYDEAGRLLYHSRSTALVGRIFPDNSLLKKALAGERVLSVSDLSHPEHVEERKVGIDRLLEIYIPIRDPGSGSIKGVYEIYTSLDPFYRRLRRQRFVVWGIVLASAVFLYVGLFIHFKRASRTIIQQSTEIEEKAQNLEKTLAELKSTQDELIRSERLATVGQLSAGIAHEVGNPLGAIMGMVDLLRRDKGEPSGRTDREEYLGRINSEIMRLKMIIRGLLDYARSTRAHLGSVDLNLLVERTLPLFRMERNFRSMDVRAEYADPPPIAWADDIHVQQVLLNLLFNAGQAMGGRGRLFVRTASQDPGGEADLYLGPFRKEDTALCVLEVKDSGPGIDPDLLPRLFQPFVTTKPSDGGVGLGLAVCQRLIEEMQGAIEVKNSPGEGASFRIYLPRAEE